MKPSARLLKLACPALAVVLSLSLVGCGGGGGGGAAAVRGRSFLYDAAGRTLAMTVDSTGRFTIVARDSGVLPAWVGAQGSIAADGSFYGQSSDAAVQFSGSVASGASPATVDVRTGGSLVLSVVAPVREAAETTPAALVGSYTRSDGATTVYLTVGPDGHATLYISTGAVSVGCGVVIGGDGSMSSADGSTQARLTIVASEPVLTVTRLNGASTSLSLVLTRVTRAKWTFMVFMNAANDLQTYGPLNMNQMEKVGSSADVNIVVQWKQAACSGCGTPDWISTRRYYVTRDTNTGMVRSQVVEDMGPNVDMGDWRELRTFLAWAQQRYPADRYALVLWNHGAGWRNTRAASPATRSVSIDDSTGSEIQTWQLPQALNTSPKVDLLIFDASLMQMIEVAHEVRNSAGIMVGSEESPPGEGYVYDPFLSDLAASPDMAPAAFAARIVERTIESYGVSSNITQSAIDLAQMDALAARMDAFARSLIFNATTYKTALYQARRDAESYLYRDNKDLWHYAELVRTTVGSSDLKAAALAVQQSLKSAVIAERHGTLHPKSNGLAVYVPDPASYLSNYGNLAFARVTEWDLWLQNQPTSP